MVWIIVLIIQYGSVATVTTIGRYGSKEICNANVEKIIDANAGLFGPKLKLTCIESL